MPDKISAIYAEAFRLEGEVARLQSALAAANARADEWQTLANTNAASLAVLTEALAAARRECEGLKSLIYDLAMFPFDYPQRINERIKTALASPAAGEEG